MDLGKNKIFLLIDDLDTDLTELYENEQLLNDVIKTIQRRPIVFENYKNDMNKSLLKEFDDSNKSIVMKKLRNVKKEDLNYKQLNYLNNKLDFKLNNLITKTKKHQNKTDLNRKKRENIVINDDIFQKEIEKIMEKKDTYLINGEKALYNKNSYGSILEKLRSSKEEEEEDILLHQDDNNFGEEIDLYFLCNQFCELTSNFKMSLIWILEEFLLNKFKEPDYPLRHNDLLRDLNKSKVKLWNSSSYLKFLDNLINEIIKNIKTYQPLLPIDYLIAKQVIPHYEKVIKKNGIINEATGDIICQYCNTLFKDNKLFKNHTHPKVSRIKEQICLKEYQLHSLMKFIESRLQKTILNLKIISKLSFNEKSKLPRFTSFELYPLSERESDKLQDKLETLNSESIGSVLGKNIFDTEENEDILHENRFIREQKEEEFDEEGDDDQLPTWLVKLKKLDEKYQCEICGNINYKGKTHFESHFNGKRHLFGLNQLGYKGDDYEIFNGITKINELNELLKEL
ncbi:hypothetical protein HANVADRAFT_50028 [Hanseniaspora valbyensis NRRL Y-1626]|uniref:Matrin-type domain-containing protein n=1 Tax=Hanseniaspora valbyensis NRRL Y-1626 TaxID=766949 RepID=A0A1B7T9P9_9ASCO|nr:hypothetical protein HANVADRAFT_50028 [Hanseniaspora valbyensis NRRL Y-1626]